MKKSNLLFLIPALLGLAACGTNNGESNPSSNYIPKETHTMTVKELVNNVYLGSVIYTQMKEIIDLQTVSSLHQNKHKDNLSWNDIFDLKTIADSFVQNYQSYIPFFNEMLISSAFNHQFKEVGEVNVKDIIYNKVELDYIEGDKIHNESIKYKQCANKHDKARNNHIVYDAHEGSFTIDDKEFGFDYQITTTDENPGHVINSDFYFYYLDAENTDTYLSISSNYLDTFEDMNVSYVASLVVNNVEKINYALALTKDKEQTYLNVSINGYNFSVIRSEDEENTYYHITINLWTLELDFNLKVTYDEESGEYSVEPDVQVSED